MRHILNTFLGVLATLTVSLTATVVHAQRSPQAGVSATFHGPGTPGFLPSCRGTFQKTNLVYNSNLFSASPWSAVTSGSTAPTITSTTDIGPDGTATATDITIGAINGTTQYSLLQQTVGYVTFNGGAQTTNHITTSSPIIYVASLSNINVGATVTGTGITGSPTVLSIGAISGGSYPITLSVSQTSIASGTALSFSSVSFGNYTNSYDWTGQVAVRDRDGPASGDNAMLSLYSPTINSWATVKIPNDGRWHLLADYIPASFSNAATGANAYRVTFQIGYDGRDTAHQPHVASVKHLAIANAQFMEGYSEGGKGWPYIANTQSTGNIAATTFTLACPPTIAFRDWGPLKPWVSGKNAVSGSFGQMSALTLQSATAALSSGANTGGLYQQGGIGNPMGLGQSFQTQGPYAGKYCGLTAATDGISNTAPKTHNAWPDFVLFCGKTPFDMTEATPGQPQLVIPGYLFPTGSSPASNSTNVNYLDYPTKKGGTPPCITAGNTVSGTPCTPTTASYPWNSYSLHAWPLPGGCTVASTLYPYCYIFTAKTDVDGFGTLTMMLAYSQYIDHGYCVYGVNGLCNNSSPSAATISATQPTAIMTDTRAIATTAQLPTTVLIGNTLYAIVATGGSNTNLWSTPKGDGVNWTYLGRILPKALPGDWDYAGGLSSRLDIALYPNRCGFFELFFTSYYGAGIGTSPKGLTKGQAISYAVASDVRGPPYIMNKGGALMSGQAASGAVISLDSPLYKGITAIGESSVHDQGGVLFWTGNVDNAGSESTGVVGFMPDACQALN